MISWDIFSGKMRGRKRVFGVYVVDDGLDVVCEGESSSFPMMYQLRRRPSISIMRT